MIQICITGIGHPDSKTDGLSCLVDTRHLFLCVATGVRIKGNFPAFRIPGTVRQLGHCQRRPHDNIAGLHGLFHRRRVVLFRVVELYLIYLVSFHVIRRSANLCHLILSDIKRVRLRASVRVCRQISAGHSFWYQRFLLRPDIPVLAVLPRRIDIFRRLYHKKRAFYHVPGVICLYQTQNSFLQVILIDQLTGLGLLPSALRGVEKLNLIIVRHIGVGGGKGPAYARVITSVRRLFLFDHEPSQIVFRGCDVLWIAVKYLSCLIHRFFQIADLPVAAAGGRPLIQAKYRTF